MVILVFNKRASIVHMKKLCQKTENGLGDGRKKSGFLVFKKPNHNAFLAQRSFAMTAVILRVHLELFRVLLSPAIP